jgi:hypothetical protein
MLAFDPARDQVGHLVGQADTLELGLLLQDGDPMSLKFGGLMSAMRPHSNRERRRSSISGISFGG